MASTRPPVSDQFEGLRNALDCTSDRQPCKWFRQALKAYAEGHDDQAVMILNRWYLVYRCHGCYQVAALIIGLINTLAPVPQNTRAA